MKSSKIWLIMIGFFLYPSISLVAGIPVYTTPCRDNTESASSTQEQKTKDKITKKQKDLENAIDDYKGALEKKREMMVKLWKTTTKIEFLMKENQVLRKEVIKYWKDVKRSHANVKSL